MNKKKKIILFSSLLLLALCTIFTILVIVLPVNVKSNFKRFAKADKVILFIGDGMGVNQVKITDLYYNKKMSFESFPYQGLVTTNSLNTGSPTDSAAAACAIASGQKIMNSYVSMLRGKEVRLITEDLKELGYGVGIITNDNIYGATPAGFSAHCQSRQYTDLIIDSQTKSNIDLFMGAGLNHYLGNLDSINEAGYKLVSNLDDISNEDTKVIASFNKVPLDNATNETPTLLDLVKSGVDFMEHNYPDKYFMMIEEAYIDKVLTNRDILSIHDMCRYVDELSRAVDYVMNYYKNMDDVCIIVTADHESGDLSEYTGSIDELSNDIINNPEGHSNQQVSYYVYLTNNKKSYKLPKLIDNTDINKMLRRLLLS